MSAAAGAASVAAYPAAKPLLGPAPKAGCPTFTAAFAVKVGCNTGRLCKLL